MLLHYLYIIFKLLTLFLPIVEWMNISHICLILDKTFANLDFNVSVFMPKMLKVSFFILVLILSFVTFCHRVIWMNYGA